MMGIFARSASKSDAPSGTPTVACRPGTLSGASSKELKGEDTFAFVDRQVGPDRVTFGLLADGHGGREAAAHCEKYTIERIAQGAADGSAAELNKSAIAAFQQLFDEVRSIPKCNAGSTLTVVALNMSRRELSTWNVGDSLGLLVHAGGYMPLGESHRLDDSADEQQRCLAMGAQLGRALNEEGMPKGGLRAYPGGLAVTRGIGDADCGDIVSPLPAYSVRELPKDGGAVIICSDGVWDNASKEDVSRILLDGRYESAASAALSVVKRVVRTRGLNDDTTAVVFLFGAREELDVSMSPGLVTPGRKTSGGLGAGKAMSRLRRRSKEGLAADSEGEADANPGSFLRRLSTDVMDVSKDGCIIAATSGEGGRSGVAGHHSRGEAYMANDSTLASGLPAKMLKDNSVRGGSKFVGVDLSHPGGHTGSADGEAMRESAAPLMRRRANNQEASGLSRLPTIESRPTTADWSSDRTPLASVLTAPALARSPYGRAASPVADDGVGSSGRTSNDSLASVPPPGVASPASLAVQTDSTSGMRAGASGRHKPFGGFLSPEKPSPEGRTPRSDVSPGFIRSITGNLWGGHTRTQAHAPSASSSAIAQRAPHKRQSLATMFDSTVLESTADGGGGPPPRRQSMMPRMGVMGGKRGSPPSSRASTSQPVSLPWHGSPHTAALPDASGSTEQSTSRDNSMHNANTHSASPTQTAAARSVQFQRGVSESDDDIPSPGLAPGWNLSSGEAMPSTRVVQYSQFDTLKYLGAGEFAQVYADMLDGTPIAVKILKQAKREEPRAVKGLKREIMLMSLMDHPNVLRALALGQENGKPFMVVERLGRLLSSELPGQVETTPIWRRLPQCRKWPLSRALGCGVQLASALAFCHDEAFVGYRILHRDVKPANIGFKPDGQLVLFDFGLATLWVRDERKGDAPRQLTGETGSLRYMAPEVANSQPYNHKAEVFSFATVVWEMACHRRPFEGYLPEIFIRALVGGARPPLPKRWDAELIQLMTSCWDAHEDKRPEFRQVVPRLEALRDTEAAAEAKRSNTDKIYRALYP